MQSPPDKGSGRGAAYARHPGPRLGAGPGPRYSLEHNDGHGFSQALGDSVVTGPTLNNVNDFRAVPIEG